MAVRARAWSTSSRIWATRACTESNLVVAAQAGGELDGGVGAVQVQVVAVERVRLDGAVGAVEGRVGADRDRGGPAGDLGAVQVQADQSAGVDAVGGRGGVRRGLQVRGREAQGPAPHVTADDHALHPVRAAEGGGGPGHVPGGQPLPDVGRGHRDAVRHEQRHAFGGEVVLLPQLGEQRDVARGLVAEPEVVPDHHGGGVQPVGQHDPDELIRAQPGELQAEREHEHRVGPQPGQQLGLPARGGEERRVRAGPDDLVRVRVEGDHDQRQVPALRDLPGPLHDALVAPVHAVEHADRRDAPGPAGRHIVQAVPAVHDPRSSFFCARPA